MSILGPRSQMPNRLGSIQVQTSEYGTAKPIGWGTFKAPVKLLDYTDFVSDVVSVGGKGGGGTGYEYYAAVDMLLCRGPIESVGNFYDGGGAANLLASTETFTIPTGGGTYQVEYGGTAFYYDEGVTYEAAYSVAANDYGSDGAITLTGTQQPPMEKVGIGATPGPLQYEVNTTGLYSFNAADAGKLVSITYAYTTTDTSGGVGSTGFNARAPILRFAVALIPGTTPQAPWTYMETHHPERAVGYTGLARIVAENMDLGSSATVPTLSVEVLNGRLKAFGSGIADCDPTVILADMLGDPVAGCNWPYLGDMTQASNFCVANSLFMSPFVDSTTKASSLIEEWCGLINCAPVWSGGLLKIVPYGDTTAVGNGRTFTPATEPIYEIDEGEMLCEKGKEACLIDWNNLADNYNQIQFEYQRRNDNYNTNTIREQDEASILMNGRLPMKTVTAHQFCEDAYAAVAMNMMLRRAAVPLRNYRYSLPWYYQLLEPMDIVILNLDTLGRTPVRITSVEEQDDYSLQFEAEDFLFGVAQGIVYPKGSSGGNAPGAHDLPGNTSLLAAFQPSTRVTGAGDQLWLALSGGSAWGGCHVWMSLDGTNYGNPIGRQYGSARAGILSAPLAAGGDPDTANTLSVVVSGSLSTVSATDADALATLSLCGTELVSYETATLTGSSTSTNSYDLTYLRRGVFSSTSQAHSAGEKFVRLDDSIFKWDIDPSLIGRTVLLKFTSLNLYGQEEQSLADVEPVSIVLGGAAAAVTMAVGSFLNSGGTTATVDVYLPGGASGASGEATLTNGAQITLPAQTWASEAPATFYAVNYNPTTSAYVLYTDAGAWLADQASGLIPIGTTTTPASGSAGTYIPTSFTDSGTSPTLDPSDAAYGSSGFATITSSAMANRFTDSSTTGVFLVNGFSGTTAAATTLSMTAALTIAASGPGSPSSYCTITATLDHGSTWTTLLSSTVSVASAPYSLAVPASTDLTGVAVVVSCYSTATSTGGAGTSRTTASVALSNVLIS